MGIQVKETSMVRPAEKTPKRKLWLSRLDLIGGTNMFSFSIHIYKPTTNNIITTTGNNHDLHHPQSFMDAQVLKESLSRALVQFYPMAGRLTKDESERDEIDCNEEGVLFIEAETQNSIVEFEEDQEKCLFTPSDKMFEQLVPKCDSSPQGIYAASAQGISASSSFPLFMVKLTRFGCGSVSLGFAQNHCVGDGVAWLHFLVSWSRLARGLELEHPPLVDRLPYVAPRYPSQVQFHHQEYDPPITMSGHESQKEATTMTTTPIMCKLTDQQINALKMKVILMCSSQGEEEVNCNKMKLTRYEVIAAHVWRTTCKARDLPIDQNVKLLIPVDGRSRLGIGEGYIGNCIFHATCVAKVGDIVGQPLSYTVRMVHTAIKKMSQQYLRSAIDFLELKPDVYLGPKYYSWANLSVNSWTKLPQYEVDYGWGRPTYAGIGGICNEGQCYITAIPNQHGSFSVTARLFTHHAALFQQYLYDDI